MADTEKIRMRIRIGGQNIPLTVAFDEQDNVREVEKRVAELYGDWRKVFPSKSEQELLAMMTYQYAYYYLELMRNRDDIASRLTALDEDLEKLIIETD